MPPPVLRTHTPGDAPPDPGLRAAFRVPSLPGVLPIAICQRRKTREEQAREGRAREGRGAGRGVGRVGLCGGRERGRAHCEGACLAHRHLPGRKGVYLSASGGTHATLTLR